LDRLEVAPGEHVSHMGAGLGYYTAILSELVGAEGRVTAIEVDEGLAARARENLTPWPNVDMHTEDGGEFDPGPADAIFVNAGVTHPHALWLDRLRDGGRLLLPLTFDVGGGIGKGVMMLIRREGDRYTARFLTLVMIYSSTSVRDAGLNELLAKQISSPKLFSVQSLRRDSHEAEDTCWLHGKDFCFSGRALA
jgi:protein-L-isoaspartate(D-aspartate) O-methyltransferase